MNLKFSTVICLLSIVLTGFFLFDSPHQLVGLADAIDKDNREIIDVNQLEQNDVIYLGENHDNQQHHARQLEIVRQLQQDANERQLAIALEMFQRPFQPILNRYLAQEIGEAELRKQTEYDTRWGFDWEYYAPILRYAKQQQIPLIALNTPEEITNKVAINGINSLNGHDFRYIPPLKDIELENDRYKQDLKEIYLQHVENGQGNSKDFDNFFAAQVLWDETMAEAIALYYQNHPKSQIVVLVGKAHAIDDYAIPNRVKRRIKDKSFQDVVYLL